MNGVNNETNTKCDDLMDQFAKEIKEIAEKYDINNYVMVVESNNLCIISNPMNLVSTTRLLKNSHSQCFKALMSEIGE